MLLGGFNILTLDEKIAPHVSSLITMQSWAAG